MRKCLIFLLMIFCSYITISSVCPQWLDYSFFYKTVLIRLYSEQVFVASMLILYLSMTVMVVIAFLRWLYQFSKEIILFIDNSKKKQVITEQQTLDNTLIIDNPKLKRPIMRFGETIFSGAVWLFFIYLFQAIPATFAWILGMQKIYIFNFSEQAIAGTMDALYLILYTALICLAILFVWAQWNYWRFGRFERRKSQPSVADTEMAEFFSLPLAVVKQMQNAKAGIIVPLPNDTFSFEEK